MNASAITSASRAELADRRLRTLRRVGLAILAVIYVGSVWLYAMSLDSDGVDDLPVAGDDGVGVVLLPRSFSPQENSLTALIRIAVGTASLDAAGRLENDLVVELGPALGESTFVQRAGTSPSPVEVVVPAFGNVENYPFDRYEVAVLVSAYVRQPDGSLDELPVRAGVQGDLIGWHLTSESSTPLDGGAAPDGGAAATAGDLGLAAVRLGRAGSTVAISLLILSLMVVLAVLGLLVARSVAIRRRRIEATMASWFGAMLFALVPLRSFLPGAPPLGSWIDILVWFWVEVALMVALAVFIASWLRLTKPPDYSHLDDPGPRATAPDGLVPDGPVPDEADDPASGGRE